MEEYVCRDGQKLRRGFTSGTCAALAAGAAVRMLLTGQAPQSASLDTPGGLLAQAPVLFQAMEEGTAVCFVQKDAGDDYDVTHGLHIGVRASRTDTPGVAIEGGEGVGRVTKPGLDQPVGTAAINRVPRQMISQAVAEACTACGYSGGISVVVFIPGGQERAKKTFNPRLGIEGGLSILGTSGIVEPRSLQALTDTIEVELRQLAAGGARRVIATPGNYSEAFLPSLGDFSGTPRVTCSNFIGDTLDLARAYHFRSLLLVGHAGKLVKLAAGVMNTHSRFADGRAEIFTAHAALAGAQSTVLRALMEAPTADACLALLEKEGLRETVLRSILDKIEWHLLHRAGELRVGAVLFSNTYGLLGATAAGWELLAEYAVK